MQRRHSPSILLYSFGLALALSLVFNGFLLHEKSRPPRLADYDAGSAVHPVDLLVWQQQLSDCKRANEHKDSLIHQLEQAPNAPPQQMVSAQRQPSD
ncbi:hypothetical protein [Spirosoma sordidisoli]|uniref:Uncharacterized protein n=1 Tax=Spirosoma sordidisoli TaxID=2502893 RepID=A0A4Q2UXE1_9BACT|nr:hypothetical protein [Spirosoma sordidisoli]RYC71719.1 hypothetical protein EQG79_06195 [Spirosoma sordidisoli]